MQLRPRMVNPRGESRPDYDIVMELATRLGMGDRFFGGSIEEGWNYILAPLGLDTATLRLHPGGIRRPLDQKERKYAVLGAEGKPLGFETETTRVSFTRNNYFGMGIQPYLRACLRYARLGRKPFANFLTC